MEGAALRRQQPRDLVIARDRERFIIGAGMHCINVECLRQRHHLIPGAAVAHDEVASKTTQFLIQAGQAGVNETQAAIVARQAVENIGVIHEDAVHLLRTAQGVVQGGVVECAQVAPEPD